MQQRLAQLGGKPCPDDSEFTCVTLTVPVDHFAPVRHADARRRVRRPPGDRGEQGTVRHCNGRPRERRDRIADSYTSYFADSIRRRFDIVFFDQRGIGLSGGLTCPTAAAVYYRSEARRRPRPHRSFSADCVDEMGTPSILPYVGTDQAIEDLEAFRNAVGCPDDVAVRRELRDAVRADLRGRSPRRARRLDHRRSRRSDVDGARVLGRRRRLVRACARRDAHVLRSTTPLPEGRGGQRRDGVRRARSEARDRAPEHHVSAPVRRNRASSALSRRPADRRERTDLWRIGSDAPPEGDRSRRTW